MAWFSSFLVDRFRCRSRLAQNFWVCFSNFFLPSCGAVERVSQWCSQRAQTQTYTRTYSNQSYSHTYSHTVIQPDIQPDRQHLSPDQTKAGQVWMKQSPRITESLASLHFSHDASKDTNSNLAVSKFVFFDERKI